VDFDDGNCPTFHNQIKGIHNVILAVNNRLPGHRQDFLLPDRSKYVNMEKRFLRSYMDLLVKTCHRRGALATGGMAAPLLPQSHQTDSYSRVLASVERYKKFNILMCLPELCGEDSL
ncbi:hypothetical protein GOODEAATRI_025536, partial [Goodea atripinnis]